MIGNETELNKLSTQLGMVSGIYVDDCINCSVICHDDHVTGNDITWDL